MKINWSRFSPTSPQPLLLNHIIHPVYQRDYNRGRPDKVR